MNYLWIHSTIFYILFMIYGVISLIEEVDMGFVSEKYKKYFRIGWVLIFPVTIIYLSFWVWQISYWILK